MLVSLFVMCGVWLISFLIKKYWLCRPGIVVSLILSIILGIVASSMQVFIQVSIPHDVEISINIRNVLITLCISMYVSYITLRENTNKK